MAQTEVYLNQKPETAAPKEGDTLKGIILDQANARGTHKFKKERDGGLTYRILKASPPSDPWGDFGNVTYYLTIAEEVGGLAPEPQNRQTPAPAPAKSDKPDNEYWAAKDERISWQHSQTAALNHVRLEIETGLFKPGNAAELAERVKTWADKYQAQKPPHPGTVQHNEEEPPAEQRQAPPENLEDVPF